MVKKVMMVLLMGLVLGGSVGFIYQRQQGQRAKAEFIALESLLQEVAKVSKAQTEISLFVPERLTYKGQPVEQNLAISALTDALLAKEMTPVESVEVGKGRLIQYKALKLE